MNQIKERVSAIQKIREALLCKETRQAKYTDYRVGDH